jgi:hypothetical protein
MKTFGNTASATLFAAVLLFIVSCKKDSFEKPPVDVVFGLSVDGYTVQFENKTVGGKSYRWEFGDGETSTEENPVHTYQGKGKYVPTLYVTADNGATAEGSTVLRIAKSSSVKLNDDSFSDWDTVALNSYTSDAAGGIFRKLKLDYDGESIYFYFEMASTVANGDIFDFYLDTDNNANTGLVTWLWNNSGNDVLLEGAMLGGWFDMFYHTGPQNSFTFDYQSTTDFFEVGHVQQDNDILKFEGRLIRTKIKGLMGKGMKMGVAATKNDWSAMLGAIPSPGTAAFYLDMTE